MTPQGPITNAERIVSIDVLRGFVVLGILVMNIQSFSMIGMAYMNPTAYGDLTGANYAVWLLSHLFADQKFMAIFSMLFGAGIIVMTSRRESIGFKTASVHYRRMVLLLIFGLLHAHLLWYGDILYTYALCGMMVYLFRHWRPRTLIIVGTTLFFVGVGITVLFHMSMPYWPSEQVQELASAWNPSEAIVAQELDIYRASWTDQLRDRSRTALFFETFLFATEFIWRAGGLMLIGMALFKLGVFSATVTNRVYWMFIAIALLVAAPVVLFGVRRNFSHDWSFEAGFHLGGLPNHIVAPLMSLGWIGVIMLICKSPRFSAIKNALTATGRMALTCYLLETIICTTIFYGHGFGQFGRISRVGQVGITIIVWTGLIIFSMRWMERFRFGPFEWFWRSATYMKAQPLRK